MKLGEWIMSLAGPLAKQALTSLGVGIVSYVGVSEAVDQGLAAARGAWGGAGGDVSSLLAMGGFNTALGIIAGGITARVTMMVTKRMMPK